MRMKMMQDRSGRRAATVATVAMTLGAALAGLPAMAADWVIGAGVADFDAGSETAVSVEVHGAPVWVPGRVEIGPAAGAVVDTDGSVWVGAGLSALAELGPRWFLEASVMPGAFDEGSAATDLGHGLEIRSLIGLGYSLSAATKV